MNGPSSGLYGDGGNDTIYGRGGADIIYGGEGDDIIDGGAGRDYIVGGEGDDTLTGGSGSDTFYFWEDHGTDTVTDFSVAEDKIYLRHFDKTITWDQLSTKITTVTDENNVVTGVQIDLSDWGGGTVILDGVTSVSDLTADMFILNVIEGEDNSDDDLVGGTSDDTMSGGTGADSFYFYEGHGADTITDFSTTEGDKIDLTSFDASITWEQLQAKMTAVADDPLTTNVDETATIIDLSDWGGGTITLDGVTSVSDLTEDMFVLDQIVGDDDSDDVLQGGTSDDTMTGGTGDDTFVFASGHGSDTITDFTDGEDTIDLSAFTGITAFSDLTVAQNGTDTVITIPGGSTITLQDFTSTDLNEADFVFHEATTMDGQQDGM